jgi:hypothetical protein
MATTPWQTFGTTIKVDGTAIGYVQDISGPGESAESVDITNHDSPSAYREKVAVILDGGELTFDIVYNSAAGQDAARAVFEARTTETIIITWPGPHTATFLGHLSTWNWAAPVAGVLTASLGITVDGPVALA